MLLGAYLFVKEFAQVRVFSVCPYSPYFVSIRCWVVLAVVAGLLFPGDDCSVECCVDWIACHRVLLVVAAVILVHG